MSKELVSVIMPTYNASKYLADSIESILSQTYADLELLITDDCSTDATLDILCRYAQQDERVKVEYLQANSGPGVARNKSIERAQGHYIAFCDSDDRWMPNKLEKQISLMTEKKCAMCNTSYIICNEADQVVGINYAEPRTSFAMQKHDNKIGCSTLIYDVQLLGHKFYMPAQRKRQDWALTLNILKECRLCFAVSEPLVCYRQRSHSVSSNKLSLVKYNVRIYEDVLGFPRWKAYLYFFSVFMPTYLLKILKRRRDSKHYLQSLQQS
jgi:glycosyltransferase involved in cell wall biosynthesis